MNTYKVRLIPLGGASDVTRNMYVYELQKDGMIQDIIIVDCGIGFPKEKELGVDFVIPDITYLKDKKDKIRAIFFSHAHEDHISALRYHYKDLGSPPVYGSKLTVHFLDLKLKETATKLNATIADYDTVYKAGAFEVKFIAVTHSIPDTTHIIIKSPIGVFYHGSDFKFDLTPPYGNPPNFYEIARCGHEGVLCMLTDCLGSERSGFTLSESIVGATFDEAIRKTKGKFVMTTFSSNISRIRQCVEAAVKYNRKICFLGRSMKQNTEVAQQIGYMKTPSNYIIKDTAVAKLPPSKVCLIVAGSQGQYDSALYKLASDQNPHIRLERGDKVLFSSDPIPGNTDEVFDVIDMLYKKDIEVVYPDIQEQLHASGHGNQEDLKLLLRLVKPNYIIPIGGELRHQRRYQKLAVELGWSMDKIILMKDTETYVFDGAAVMKGDMVSVKPIYVDAYGVGDVGNIMLRDRRTLSEEGMVFVAVPITERGECIRDPEFMTRGFIFKTDEGKLFATARDIIKKVLIGEAGRHINKVACERKIISELEKYFLKQTGREPLISVSLLIL